MPTAAASTGPAPRQPEPPTGLFWNEQGALACSAHVPDFEGPVWFAEGWTVLSPGEFRAWRAATGRDPFCTVGGRDNATCGPRPTVAAFATTLVHEETAGGLTACSLKIHSDWRRGFEIVNCARCKAVRAEADAYLAAVRS